jgi:hypothetical protein
MELLERSVQIVCELTGILIRGRKLKYRRIRAIQVILNLIVNLAECALEQKHLNDKGCYGYR